MKPRQPPRISRFEGRCQVQQVVSRRPGRCGETSDRTSAPQDGGGFFVDANRKEDRMSLESLRCKECGTSFELGAHYFCENCFGPLEVAYDHSALDPAEAKRRIQAGSQGIWRYADFLPFAGPPGRPARAGPDAAAARRPARRAPRARRRALDQERRRQPDPLLQGPGRRRRRRQGPGARLRHRRLRLDRQPRQRGRRPRRRRRPRLLRLRPRQPRGAEAARDRRLRDQPGRRARQLRRRQPALHPARRSAALGLRQRQPAPLLRRGLEDARLRDRRAARLGAARPGRLPDRLGLAVHQARPRLPGVARRRPRRAASSRSSTAPSRQGCSPVATAFAEGWDVCKPQKPETIAKSLAIGDPADGPYALEHARADRRPDRLGRRRRDPRRRSGLLAETTGIFTETAGGVTVGVLRKLAERGEIAAGERVVVYLTGEGLKTLDADPR